MAGFVTQQHIDNSREYQIESGHSAYTGLYAETGQMKGKKLPTFCRHFADTFPG